MLGLGDPGSGGPRGEGSPCLWHSGPRLALQGRSVWGRTWGGECIILQECFPGSVLGFCPLLSGDGLQLLRVVWLWPAPGLGSRRMGALGLAGGLPPSHGSAGHGVMGFPAGGSCPACSRGHLRWRHSGGFVLLPCWPETLSHFQCGPAAPGLHPPGSEAPSSSRSEPLVLLCFPSVCMPSSHLPLPPVLQALSPHLLWGWGWGWSSSGC